MGQKTEEWLDMADSPVEEGVESYSGGEGSRVDSRDATLKLLVRKYGIAPEQAALLASQINAGKSDSGIRSEALTGVANREKRRLDMMDRYVRVKSNPSKASPADLKYMQAVDARYQQVLQEKAAALQAREQARQQDQARQADPVGYLRNQGVSEAQIPATAAGINPKYESVKAVDTFLTRYGLNPDSAAQIAMQLHGISPKQAPAPQAPADPNGVAMLTKGQ